MRIDVISLFPEFVDACAGFGVVGRARERGLLSMHGWNPRDYAEGNYRRVDDRPFGGGPGMVMLVDPLRAAIAAARDADPQPAHVVYMSPQGRLLDQARVRELAALPRMILLCGRYEGVDERVLEAHRAEEVSLGDFVLSGGEPAALALIDAVVRLLPGVMGNEETAGEESFERGLLEYPHYTRPADWQGRTVPEVLLSGHHEKVRAWRLAEAERITRARRPDLWSRYEAAREAEEPRKRRRRDRVVTME